MPNTKPVTNGGPVTPSKPKNAQHSGGPNPELETPRKIRYDLDNILEQLNSTWSLDLPRIRGTAASQMESTSALAKRCSARLRYLCFRLENLDTWIKDFEERARIIHSGWVFKPRGDRNLIVPRNVSEPNLKRAAAKGKMPQLAEEQVQQLLQCLDAVLQDPYDLARDTDSFNSTSGATASSSIAPPAFLSGPNVKRTKPNVTATPRISAEPEDIKISKMPNKRTSSYDDSHEINSKKAKIPATSPGNIRQFLIPVDKTTFSRHQPQPELVTSFDSAPGSTDEIFSQGDDDSRAVSSNATTVLDEFPDTQDAHDLLQDPGLLRSLEDLGRSDRLGPRRTLSERLDDTFKPLPTSLPPNLDFDFKYELHSLSLDLNIRIETLLTQIQKECGKRFPSPAERYRVYKTLARGTRIERFSERSWNPSLAHPDSARHHYAMYLSTTLTVDPSANDRASPYRVKLNAPIVDKSCRLYRKFDNRTLMILNLPVVQKGELSKDLPYDEVYDEVVRWLSKPLHIAGLEWRAFFIDDQVRVRKDDVRFRQVHLFAVNGDQPTVSLRDFMDWHIPWTENVQSTDLKLFARFKLALSKTTPTVVIEQEDFIEVPDKQNPGGQVMDDGAGLMSFSLAKAVSACAGLFEIPSVFQGRVSGAKGVWIVVPDYVKQCRSKRGFWITVSPSQLKIKPHPRHRVCDPEHRTFEISAFSKTLRPASLNTQLITVLHNQGVTKEVLEARLKEHSQEYYTSLRQAVDDSNGPAIRAWLQRYHPPVRNGEITMTGSVPSQKTDKQSMLLDAGFLPKDCNIMHDLLRLSLKDRLSEMTEKINPEIPESTTPFIIPDPYDVLDEGTAMLCLPEGGFTDPRTGMPFSHVDGRHALVARNPAYWPSDMQKIKLVYNLQLACFKNVLIFSTKGLRPLADLLSGGDYDGDKAFITWDREIVDQFKNYDGPAPDAVRPEDCYVKQESRPLSEIFQSNPRGGPSLTEVEKYLDKCICFNLSTSPLGMVSNEHAKLVYSLSLKGDGKRALNNDGAIKLGALAGFLVDAFKQGYRLPIDDFYALRRLVCGFRRLNDPAYTKKIDFTGYNEKNINDYLKFKVAKQEMDNTLTHWSNHYSRSGRLDEALKRKVTEFKAMATEDASGVTQRISAQLELDIRYITGRWARLVNDDNLDPRTFSLEVSQLHREFLQIEPLQVPGQEDAYRYRFFAEAQRLGQPVWPAIRACYLYCATHKAFRSLAWNMAADQLCEIKAKSLGSVTTVTMRMWATLKVDKRIASTTVTWGDIGYHDIEDEEEDETQYFDAESELPANNSLIEWLNF
ncbi:putative RNA-dependent RNA polymerase 2 [Cyphellophora attinorum]|uniref:RNA-dependent RNA polymerase n=1 Tax=Cyphellophora attinorum TaxID=1664694 RepID=A0A0N0NJI9_9EURO|nr:putative RNA-dependent RNA polymerase 2 [Phialophora attinorum]KPI36699.1 putative RNA-dependent RNA polymerase 2 [Phialophora attinorum]